MFPKVSFTLAALLILSCGFSSDAPAQFTSSQRVVVGIPKPFCDLAFRFKANPYTLKQQGNKITILYGESEPTGAIVGTCPPQSELLIDLGILPPGDYTYAIGESIQEIPIRVTDHRATKAAPYVLRDYSGTWWDAADPGWGLFIWQDANSSKDSLLIAWFTYDPSGQPVWYTFQPEWATSTATKEGTLFRSTRPLGVGTPPPGDTTRVAVGTASIDFTSLRNEAFVATFKYQLGSSPAVTKRIVPFKP
jgi:hypothetical protein